MPNRIIREGILTSEAVDSLSDQAELFYRRLLSVVDDHGLFHGNPKLIRAACYPLRLDRVSDDDVRRYIDECREADLIGTPTISGKPIIVVRKFGQQVRAKSSKYVPEETGDELQRHLDQMQADAGPAPRDRTATAQQPRSVCVADAKHPRADAHLDGDGVVVGDVVEGVVGEREATSPRPNRSPTGSRIPPDFPAEPEIEFCRQERPDLDPRLLTAKFRDFWAGVPGVKGRKCDWPATWRNFVRSEFARSPPARASPTRADRLSATVAALTGRQPKTEVIDVIATEAATVRLG